jgi:uncharacterized protein YyaL (SSP411 family)
VANRLARETSPYLLQHAENPVAWWPWGDEAFAEAQRRDVPVFLSVGYSTCHWCHVMAHESFEDADVARLLNDAFVCVKVDREERPDVDDAYMAACQAMTGRGGWPLTAVLDHERRAWFAGTYFPRTTRGHLIGMTDLVPRLATAWRDQRDDVTADATHLAQHLAQPPEAPSDPDPDWHARVVGWLRDAYDPQHGGFGRAPKFPTPHVVAYALHDDTTRAAALHTLAAIADGGIHDHVGGGFHRYSTDGEWRLPHFEKMLYDQAGLLGAYAQAWRLTGDRRWRNVCADIVGYVVRDLRADDGAFFAAEDADSDDGTGHAEEGAFYVWTRAEVERVLGADARAFCRAFDVRRNGNHADEATGQATAKNVLFCVGSADTDWTDALARLRKARDKRPRPHRDEKVLADWNGLMIAALSGAGAALGEAGWVQRAVRAADALSARLGDGAALLHVARPGGGVPAFLADHAAVGAAAFALFEATHDVRWLVQARGHTDAIRADFQDGAGRLHASRRDGEKLPGRATPAGDGAVPSPAATAIALLARVGLATADSAYDDAAWRALRGVAPAVTRAPAAHAAVVAAARIVTHGVEVVVTGTGVDADALLAAARLHGGPASVLIHAEGRGVRAELAWLGDMTDDVAAYVCRDHACERPVRTAETLRRAFRGDGLGAGALARGALGATGATAAATGAEAAGGRGAARRARSRQA